MLASTEKGARHTKMRGEVGALRSCSHDLVSSPGGDRRTVCEQGQQGSEPLPCPVTHRPSTGLCSLLQVVLSNGCPVYILLLLVVVFI